MRIITIASSRPELIRLHIIIKKLDLLLKENHVFIYTGQNFTDELSTQFFADLSIRQPDYKLNVTEKMQGFEFGGLCMNEIHKILSNFNAKYDKILILGDVNGAFYSAYVAKMMGFKIYHMEAGNRCFDEKVPEEINRRAIDSFSYKLLTYTQRSRENLLREGYLPHRIIVIGNPIGEVLKEIKEQQVDLNPDILVTLHRTENITNKEILTKIINQLNLLSEEYKILISLHPKLKDYLQKYSLSLNKNIVSSEPFNLSTFITLEKKSKLIISDSGTIPEECAILGKPCILIRDSTERPELLECNQMIVSSPISFIDTAKIVLSEKIQFEGIPEEYTKSTSDIVIKLLLGGL